MRALMVFIVVAMPWLTGCASYRFTTTLKPSSQPPALGTDVRFSIASAKYSSRGDLAPGSIPSFGTPDVSDAQLSAWLMDMASERYPDIFSSSPTALPLDVSIERTAYETFFSPMACVSCLSLVIIPLTNREENDFEVRVTTKTSALSALLTGAVRFKRMDESWNSVSPLGLIPLPGPSDVPKVSGASGDANAMHSARDLTLSSCVEAIVQILRRIDPKYLGPTPLSGTQQKGQIVPGIKDKAETFKAMNTDVEAIRKRLSVEVPSDQAWRKDPAVFVDSVTRIANEAKRPEAKDIDAPSLIIDMSGGVWVDMHAGKANELHGALAAAFSGDVMWPCKVKSVGIDDAKGICNVEVFLPSSGPVPQGLELPDSAFVAIPLFALAPGFTPSSGDSVTIIGLLKDGPSEGVYVSYGMLASEGKTKIRVKLVGLSIEKR